MGWVPPGRASWAASPGRCLNPLVLWKLGSNSTGWAEAVAPRDRPQGPLVITAQPPGWLSGLPVASWREPHTSV